MGADGILMCEDGLGRVLFECAFCGFKSESTHAITAHQCKSKPSAELQETLRDKFAMAALPEIMKNVWETTTEKNAAELFNSVAKLAYKQAEAMLEARKK